MSFYGNRFSGGQRGDPDPWRQRPDPVEKMFRDARASMIEDGVNESLMLGAFDWLK